MMSMILPFEIRLVRREQKSLIFKSKTSGDCSCEGPLSFCFLLQEQDTHLFLGPIKPTVAAAAHTPRASHRTRCRLHEKHGDVYYEDDCTDVPLLL